MLKRLGSIAVMAAAIGTALAMPALAGRPLETEDAGIVPPGSFEVELAGKYESGNVVSKSFTLETNLAYGLCSQVELDLAGSGVVYGNAAGDDITGLNDSSLLLKWRFLGDDGTPLAVAAGASLSLPTGNASQGLSSDAYDTTVFLAASYTPGELGTVHVKAAYNLLESADDTVTGFVAFERPLTDVLALVVEAGLDQSAYGQKDDKSGRGLIGCTWAVSENVVIDIGVGAGFDNRTPDTIAVFGATCAF